MASYGRIDEYVEGEDFTQYKERLEHYFKANDINVGAKKVSIFLSVVGAKTYALLRNLIAPDAPGDKTFAQLTEVLEKHFQPRQSEIVQRYKFNIRTRGPGETLNSFVAELRKLAQGCNFGDQLDNMLRDRFVVGVNDKQIQ